MNAVLGVHQAALLRLSGGRPAELVVVLALLVLVQSLRRALSRVTQVYARIALVDQPRSGGDPAEPGKPVTLELDPEELAPVRARRCRFSHGWQRSVVVYTAQISTPLAAAAEQLSVERAKTREQPKNCLLYTSPSPRDRG